MEFQNFSNVEFPIFVSITLVIPSHLSVFGSPGYIDFAAIVINPKSLFVGLLPLLLVLFIYIV